MREVFDAFRELITDNADAADRGTLTKGRETEVNGEPVIPVTRAQGDERLTVYVAAEPRIPVRIAVRGSGEEGTVDFSGFDRPVPARTPSADETVDVTALLGRGREPV
ncbi:Lipoprotein OS=Streptomyces microflavus OX=1919 GN=Smic_68990 PE=4 SV=1 [Streptomyces microflavus]